ncbi:hypothetical protein AAU57_12060 [Nonlabens sp. YIK11]|uniref:hypothetical protein n=1 Tax=Nonlabens sp. YIK11 TaxID=1453349 RepID=UPI0006DC1BB4|nr:hypothetical protein [Nonlabens sp. YIK11]KQC33982.1 hypothetical protein AAU57_12060 [Nonlabens sp. YIK11]
MSLIKIVLYVVLLIALTIWIAQPSIDFKPFKISFTNGYYAIGFTLVFIGLGFIKYQGHQNGKKQVMEVVEEMIKSGDLK